MGTVMIGRLGVGRSVSRVIDSSQAAHFALEVLILKRLQVCGSRWFCLGDGKSVKAMSTALKAGRYEITGELGRGAMGVVYKATDPVIGRTVAVKTIKLSEEGTGLSRPELLARFQTEARAAGLLTHPNIVVVFDAGEEDGLYYITMELVEGRSLQAHLDGGQAFALPRVLRIMEQTCSALQFAHERSVVHRDIKPANIMLTADDTVKVTDFGTAKILQFGTMQQTAHVMGTPSYMSPEQVKGRAVDGRSDIFSLGVMLYEMVTGEKPFPGQNITTVIYKIVNEEPVPPRQIDPSIHPGISAVVMKALAKEPEARYQSCREMLEDLRNYRSIAPGGGPDKTMVAGGQGAPNATLQLAGMGIGAQGGRQAYEEDPMTMATTRSLNVRASSPTQTPTVRRTGPITPIQEPPKKKSVIGSVFVALILIGVIVYGIQKLRPVFEDARQINAAQKNPDNVSATTGAVSAPASNTANNPPTSPATSPDRSPAESEPPATANPEAVAPEKKPVQPSVQKPAAKKSELVVSPEAAEYKGRIDQIIAERGLTGRARVQAIGNTLVLAGKLRPTEHGDLLKFLRNAPASVRVVDNIEYVDVPAAGNVAEGGHPVTSPNDGAIHVITDLVGATALLRDSAGRVVNRCQTPCSFSNLTPAQYSLEVEKAGYQSMQTALQVKAGSVIDQKATLESLTQGLYLTSRPAGADVFINGAKQSGQTPVTLPLAPGNYNLVVRLPGYEAYAGKVQVKDNIQTQLSVELNSRVAWAQVDTNPKGAEIFLDGTTTGQTTPARVQMPAGLHTLIVRLPGYQQVKRTVQASEGGTVSIEEALKPR
ncbi:MAG TPA: PEGA domain-containing protein [Candidatus Solibacter sp.]|nr:PEGA domain-containing protein [Candidatus Solibacter sp.]